MVRNDYYGELINRAGSGWALVPVGLREDGTRAQILFPTDLTPAEADKIARVIKAYAEGEPDDRS